MTQFISNNRVFLILFSLIVQTVWASPFLWKVENSEVYILGSIHVADSSFYPLDSSIIDAWEASDQLVVEANVLAPDPKLQQFMLNQVIQPKIKTVAVIDSLTLGKIKSFADEVKVPIAAFLQTPPWLTAFTITQVAISKTGTKSADGIDLHFLKLALKEKKDILEIEDPLLILKSFSDMSTSLQLAFLEETLNEVKEIDSEFKKLIKYWKEGDAENLSKLVNDTMTDKPKLKDFTQQILYERNKAWAPVIKDLIKRKKKTLVVVGAAHLIGEKSLFDYLNEFGIKATRVEE